MLKKDPITMISLSMIERKKRSNPNQNEIIMRNPMFRKEPTMKRKSNPNCIPVCTNKQILDQKNPNDAMTISLVMTNMKKRSNLNQNELIMRNIMLRKYPTMRRKSNKNCIPVYTNNQYWKLYSYNQALEYNDHIF